MELEYINLEDYVLIKPDYILNGKLDKEQNFYDIEVEDNHTFFICNENGDFEILSHNCDGYHIRSLLINLFNTWFPWIIEQGKISILETPLVTIGDKNKKYFYSLQDFLQYGGQKTNVRYLKGLGSLSLQDWDHVMASKNISEVKKDPSANKNLNMAFGKFSSLRKDWLSSK